MTALSSHTTEPSAQTRLSELEQAFVTFNETSAHLETAYRELEARAAALAHELAEARSERLRQLAEKERLAARLERLLETLPAAILVLDGAARVAELNPGAIDMLGEPLVGCTLDEILTRVGARPIEGGELELAGGHRVSIATRALLAEPGRIVLLTDVTETRRLQALLERNERLSAMGEMSARLAHQTRTPLTAAILYASQLAAGDIPPPAAQRFAGKLLSRLHHIERLVNDMLSFARGGSAGLDDIVVADLITEVAQMAEGQGDENSSVHFDPPPAELRLRGNREALTGAMLNLVTNALQVSQGPVDIAARASASNGVELSVSDDGPGVSPALKDKIFEPFFTTRASGTGLGLAVVQSVARAHGGHALVTDNERGGATFRIHLPPVGERALPSRPQARATRQNTDAGTHPNNSESTHA